MRGGGEGCELVKRAKQGAKGVLTRPADTKHALSANPLQRNKLRLGCPWSNPTLRSTALTCADANTKLLAPQQQGMVEAQPKQDAAIGIALELAAQALLRLRREGSKSAPAGQFGVCHPELWCHQGMRQYIQARMHVICRLHSQGRSTTCTGCNAVCGWTPDACSLYTVHQLPIAKRMPALPANTAAPTSCWTSCRWAARWKS